MVDTIASAVAYEVLCADKDLQKRMDEIRGYVDPLDGVYIGTPDFGNVTDTDIIKLSPWIRITDVPGDFALYADDERILEAPVVQADFWVKKELIPEASELDKMIQDSMHDAGWERITHNSYVDHDTPQLRMITATFSSQGLPA